MAEILKTIISYRMPFEKDFYSLVSNSPISINSKSKTGFFFSDFETNAIYNITNPIVYKNEWKIGIPFLKQSPSPTSKENYICDVEKIINEINQGELKKVVYSRIKQFPKSKDFELEKTFRALCNSYENAFVYCISSPEKGTWMGATPEILIHKNKTSFRTVSLAGTRIDNTRWTEKERNEQKVVTDYITSIINDFCKEILVSKPYEMKAGEVYHLKTDIQLKLNNENELWKIINCLHPTPAICGIPLGKSKQLIGQLERHDRELYTGFIGPIGINNHTSLFVNLRSMQISKTYLNLYLGGGIMGDSIPENEWTETENKATTLLSVLK